MLYGYACTDRELDSGPLLGRWDGKAEERNDGGRRPNHETAKRSEVLDVAWKSREMLNKAASARLGGMRVCHGVGRNNLRPQDAGVHDVVSSENATRWLFYLPTRVIV